MFDSTIYHQMSIQNINSCEKEVFPPSSAPETIKIAWKETVEGLTENEILLGTAIICMQAMLENRKRMFDDQATVMKHGESGYKDVLNGDVEDYLDLINKVLKLSTLSYSKLKQMNLRMDIMNRFKKNILKHLS